MTSPVSRRDDDDPAGQIDVSVHLAFDVLKIVEPIDRIAVILYSYRSYVLESFRVQKVKRV